MPNATPIKLPFFARRIRLPQLPEQPAGSIFAVVKGIDPEPTDSLGYLVELADRSHGRIVAHLSLNGRVYRTDRPLIERPDGNPDLLIASEKERDGGTVFRADPSGSLEPIGRYRGSATTALREEAVGTWNAEHPLGIRDFLATMFLRYCEFTPSEHAAASHEEMPAGNSFRIGTITIPFVKLERPVEIFAGFQNMSLPDAIETLIYRIDANPNPCGIERLARRELSGIDLERLRALTSISDVHLARIERTGSFYLNFNRRELTEEDIALLFDVEATLNRLAHTLDLIASHALDSVTTSLAPLNVSPSEEDCARIRARAMRSAAIGMEHLLSHIGEPNPWGNPGAHPCKPGGRWDVLTRLARLCEGIRLETRLEYLLRFDPVSNRVTIAFTSPLPSAMPRSTFSPEKTAWYELSEDERRARAQEYAARTSLLLAASAFSANLHIARCVVEELEPSGKCERAYAFERTAFLAEWLPLENELITSPLHERRVFLALAERAAPPQEEDDGCERAAALRPFEDTRLLPQPLRDMMLADTPQDLEVMEQPNPRLQRVSELRELAQTDRELAARGLTELIEELQATCVAAELMADCSTSSQYCDSYISRMLLGLDQDDKSLRINRVPDALFNAQFELANMYLRTEMFDAALAEARKLLDMASTSSSAHFAVINALARLERFDELADVAKHGLAVAYDREAAAYYFYRLAFACWRQGDRDTALACYRMVPRGDSVERIAREEMHALMLEMGRAEPPSLAEAQTHLHARGIAVPPTEHVANFIADAAVLFCEHGFDFLAARCVFEMWRAMGHDELGVLHKSLTYEMRGSHE